MQKEQLLLKQRDRGFPKVLHEIDKGHITERQAAEQLKVADRWADMQLLWVSADSAAQCRTTIITRALAFAGSVRMRADLLSWILPQLNYWTRTR